MLLWRAVQVEGDQQLHQPEIRPIPSIQLLAASQVRSKNMSSGMHLLIRMCSTQLLTQAYPIWTPACRL